VGKFFTLLASVSLLFEDADRLLHERGRVENGLRPELVERGDIQWFALLRSQQSKASVFRFNAVEQTVIRDGMQVRKDKESQIFADPHAGREGTQTQRVVLPGREPRIRRTSEWTWHLRNTAVYNPAMCNEKQ
jgi:hypothetical protein